MTVKPRRAKGTGGTPYQRADGRWQVQYTDGDGKRRYVYAPSRAEAQRKRTDALRGVAQNGLRKTPFNSLTVAEHCAEWLREVIAPNRAATTVLSYTRICQLHITPQLGHLRLDALTPAEVQAWVANQTSAPRTIQKHHAVLRAALRVAVRWERITRNPAERAALPRARQVPRVVLTSLQAQQFLEAAKGDRLEALFVLLLTTACRQGELFGLRWTDIDWAGRQLHIRNNLQRLPGTWVEGPPKSDSGRRVIPLGELAYRALQSHQLRVAVEQAGADEWPRADLVFTSAHGRPLRRENVQRGAFTRILRQAGLAGITFHALRRSAATLMLERGQPVEVVSRMLGHSSVSMTYQSYRELLPGELRTAADVLDAMLRPT